MLKTLWNDELGFIVSAELVLVATILVIGVIVGLVSVQCSVVAELNDVGDAIGSMNQSFSTSGFRAQKDGGGNKARTFGSEFEDAVDTCDNDSCGSLLVCDDGDEQVK